MKKVEEPSKACCEMVDEKGVERRYSGEMCQCSVSLFLGDC